MEPLRMAQRVPAIETGLTPIHGHVSAAKVASYFGRPKSRFDFAYFKVPSPVGPQKNSGPFGVFERHINPGNYFWDLRGGSDDKPWSVSFHNRLVWLGVMLRTGRVRPV